MITVGGVDLTTLGFVPLPRDLPRLGGERSVVVPVPGAVGGVHLGGRVEPGRIRVEGTVSATDHSALLARLDQLAAQLRGEQTIRFADVTDREWVGRLVQGPSAAGAIGPAWTTRAHAVTLEWTLPDPTARAQTETVGAGTPQALALGTAPSPLRITVTNGATADITQVVVNVRTGGGGGPILRSLVWNGVLLQGDALVIDAETFQVTNDGANAIDGLTAASEFPVADPADGADTVNIGVTGGGGETRESAYRKRWW